MTKPTSSVANTSMVESFHSAIALPIDTELKSTSVTVVCFIQSASALSVPWLSGSAWVKHWSHGSNRKHESGSACRE
jgi:hypothetical protein